MQLFSLQPLNTTDATHSPWCKQIFFSVNANLFLKPFNTQKTMVFWGFFFPLFSFFPVLETDSR